MHTAGSFASGIQTGNNISLRIKNLCVCVDLQTAHRVMDARRNLDGVVGRGIQRGSEGQAAKLVVLLIGDSLVPGFHRRGEGRRIDAQLLGQLFKSRALGIVAQTHMLADTVEAAVRSMLGSGKTLAEAESVIKTLIKDKLDDGQLNNSGLGIHELEIIRRAFLKVFQGMYHERVAYPKQEEINAAAKKGAEESKAEEKKEKREEKIEEEKREEESSEFTD